MSDLNFKERILLIINEIKGGKLRPDESRICKMLSKRYNDQPDNTRTKLQELVEEKILNTVYYKGAISYRILSSGPESPKIIKSVQLEDSVNVRLEKRKRVSFLYFVFFLNLPVIYLSIEIKHRKFLFFSGRKRLL